MPIEIRELIIKTEISTGNRTASDRLKEKELNTLKKQVLEECRRMIVTGTKKTSHKR